VRSKIPKCISCNAVLRSKFRQIACIPLGGEVISFNSTLDLHSDNMIPHNRSRGSLNSKSVPDISNPIPAKRNSIPHNDNSIPLNETNSSGISLFLGNSSRKM
jgi:hypothetical protein